MFDFPTVKPPFHNNPELFTEGIPWIVMIDLKKWPVPSWLDSSVGSSFVGSRWGSGGRITAPKMKRIKALMSRIERKYS